MAVVVPAHDEAAGIAATLRSLGAQLGPRDRLVVVADNCTDATAAIARAEGAEVVERQHATLRGKGYALDAGVRALAASPPAVVVFVDADCTLAAGAVDRLAQAAVASGRPVQGLYLMHPPPAASLATRIAGYAWIVRNAVRPAGALRLGWPCQLMGTGMALPWALAREARLATGHLVEDMQLGIDLASAGRAPLFCPAARIDSVFPADREALRTQRERWERGHAQVAAAAGLPLLVRSLAAGDGARAAMALDLLVPPLAGWAALAAGALAVDGLRWAAGGHPAPFAIAATATGLVAAALARAWWRHARHLVGARELAVLPLYVAARLPLYARLVRRRPPHWVRTGRDVDPR